MQVKATRCHVGALLAAVVIAAVSQATTVIPMTDAEMVRDAGIILSGTVIGVSSEWTADHGQIHTLITVSIDTFLKRSLPEKTIVLRMLGGAVGDTTLLIPDSPSFAAGQEVILLLRPNYSSLFPIVGFNQGKFTVDLDPATGQKIIEERQVPAADFISTIRQLINEQR